MGSPRVMVLMSMKWVVSCFVPTTRDIEEGEYAMLIFSPDVVIVATAFLAVCRVERGGTWNEQVTWNEVE